MTIIELYSNLTTYNSEHTMLFSLSAALLEVETANFPRLLAEADLTLVELFVLWEDLLPASDFMLPPELDFRLPAEPRFLADLPLFSDLALTLVVVGLASGTDLLFMVFTVLPPNFCLVTPAAEQLSDWSPEDWMLMTLSGSFLTTTLLAVLPVLGVVALVSVTPQVDSLLAVVAIFRMLPEGFETQPELPLFCVLVLWVVELMSCMDTGAFVEVFGVSLKI